MFPIALLIGPALEVGLPMIKKLFKSGKFDKWIDLFEQAANGVAGAIEAVNKIKDAAACI